MTGRRALLLGSAWVILFSASVLITRLAEGTESNSKTTGYVASTAENEAQLDELMELPSKTTAPRYDNPLLHTQEFAHSLDEEMLRNIAQLRGCKQAIMQGTGRTVELVEFSFMLEPLEDGTSYAFSDVVIERATVKLNREAEDCVIAALQDFDLTLQNPPRDRMSYSFCVRQSASTMALHLETGETP